MDELGSLLRNLEIFRSLSAAELRAVSRACARRSLRDGEPLDAAGALVLVEEGQVLISRLGPEGREIPLATFVAGESFGELALFQADGGDTSARCEGDCRLLLFPASGGAPAFFESHPAIAAKVLNALLGVMARRIRSTNRLIAEKSPWVKELRRQVLLDKLTGLYNAIWLEEDFATMLAEGPGGARRAGARRAGACLLMIKPDNFKVVNDTCGGHHAGDRVLQLMAGRLRSILGESGVAIRYRGDVLAAALPGLGLKRAREVAERVRQAFRALDLSEVGPVRITVSVGVACGRCGADVAAEVVHRAYANLFTARNGGGDRVRSVFRGGGKEGR